MALTHYLRFNNSITDAIAGTWSSSGTVTSQPTQGFDGNYYFNTGNLLLTESATLNTATFMGFVTNRSSTDSDGKILDARGGGGYFCVVWTPGTTKIGTYRNGVLADYTYGSWSIRLHIAARFDGTNLKLYINGVERATVAASTAINYTTIRLGQENAGTPNRRFLGDADEYRLYNNSLSVAEINNHRISYLGFF